ncbi:hypothetical protein SKAU_G00092170 [Synaphobranchus kaupii]|uniref:Uncharacterized protein n=1 Tax=Synaphobranchus kaupii TaxID=118154 RepID=A0A9Q1FWL9_SYNKA|nr:hypothetical protein SKAU_G00092170 [Synaphobranchus kaupii]
MQILAVRKGVPSARSRGACCRPLPRRPSRACLVGGVDCAVRVHTWDGQDGVISDSFICLIGRGRSRRS